LTKWYVDCVTTDNRVAIAYWVSVQWRSIALRWASVSVHEPGCEPRHRTTLRPGPAPEMRDGVLALRTPVCRAGLTATQPEIDTPLYDSACGCVAWRCAAPAAVVSMRPTGATPLHGVGYAERLTLTIPPWQLPISELRWGRWSDLGARHSVIWIDWRGAAPRTWVFVNGEQARTATVTDSGVCADGLSLALSSPRVLLDRDLGEVLRAIPPLRGVRPASLHGYHESKWTSAGVLTTPTAPPLSGESIHEIVRFA
jgi:hypothetical protein